MEHGTEIPQTTKDSSSSPVVVALDFDDINSAKALVSQLSPNDCRLKIGKEMFTLFGPDWVKYCVYQGFDVFLDLKFHDIPNTVAKAVAAASKLGIWMVNVHASGGEDMVRAAKQSIEDSGKDVLLTAVTILTSMDERQFAPIYPKQTIANKVKDLALLAQNSGADGVVCSAQEANMLRTVVDSEFKLVTPGIRPAGSSVDDQKRILTPPEAIEQGVDYMVIGRPITKAEDPAKALKDILASL